MGWTICFAAREDSRPAMVSTSTKTHSTGVSVTRAVWTALTGLDRRTTEPSFARRA